MGWSTTNRISHLGVNCQVEVDPVWISRICTRDSHFIATLPPTVLSDYNTRIERFPESGLGTHCSCQGADLNPMSILNSSRDSRRRMNLDFGVRSPLPQSC